MSEPTRIQCAQAPRGASVKPNSLAGRPGQVAGSHLLLSAVAPPPRRTFAMSASYSAFSQRAHNFVSRPFSQMTGTRGCVTNALAMLGTIAGANPIKAVVRVQKSRKVLRLTPCDLSTS